MIEDKDMLRQELSKLSPNGLKRIAQLWSMSDTSMGKRALMNRLIHNMQDSFYVKGILEKLSNTQTTIYASLLQIKSNMMTLGEIARKISLPPLNAEMELGVLKRYYLVYQCKDRARLTNNLDRYHCYPESGNLVTTDTNEDNHKIQVDLPSFLMGKPIAAEWKKILGRKSGMNGSFDAKTTLLIQKSENITRIIAKIGKTEQIVIQACFLQGGILEMGRVRKIVRMEKGDWESIVRRLHSSGIVVDDYYIDKKFIRIMIMPQDVFTCLQENPLTIASKRKSKNKGSKIVKNDLDFYLNIKKMISYISGKGISLAKSGKIKQIDLRETEATLLNLELSLFIEKSQTYQIDLLLPVMRLLDIVRVKREDIVLRNDYEKILTTDCRDLINQVIPAVLGARNRRVPYEEVFELMNLSFPLVELWDECLEFIQNKKKIMHFIIMASVIRKRIILNGSFEIADFQKKLMELNRELTSVLFWLQTFGLIQMDTMNRELEISEVGDSSLNQRDFRLENTKGSVILNADMSLIVIPEKISIPGLTTLKSFTELKSFDNVYTLQITKQSFQRAILYHEDSDTLVKLLEQTSRNPLSQNFLFSIKDWASSIPVVKVMSECVLVQTAQAEQMDLLLGRINGKHIVQEHINKNTILIYSNKIPEFISSAEKLSLLVKLIR